VAYAEQSVDGEVFVDGRPVDAVTGGGNFEVGALGRGGGEQARGDFDQGEVVVLAVDAQAQAVCRDNDIVNLVELFHRLASR